MFWIKSPWNNTPCGHDGTVSGFLLQILATCSSGRAVYCALCPLRADGGDVSDGLANTKLLCKPHQSGWQRAQTPSVSVCQSLLVCTRALPGERLMAGVCAWPCLCIILQLLIWQMIWIFSGDTITDNYLLLVVNAGKITDNFTFFITCSLCLPEDEKC